MECDSSPLSPCGGAALPLMGRRRCANRGHLRHLRESSEFFSLLAVIFGSSTAFVGSRRSSRFEKCSFVVIYGEACHLWRFSRGNRACIDDTSCDLYVIYMSSMGDFCHLWTFGGGSIIPSPSEDVRVRPLERRMRSPAAPTGPRFPLTAKLSKIRPRRPAPAAQRAHSPAILTERRPSQRLQQSPCRL
jgi:hypothetical protein